MASILSYLQALIGRLRSALIYQVLYPLRARQLRSFFEPEIQSWDLIFDLGGHRGDKTRFFTRYSAQIIVLEPHPFYFNQLQQRFADSDKVTVIQAGVSDKIGQLLFYPSPNYPSVSTFNSNLIKKVRKSPNWTSVIWNDPISIPTTTLDQLIKDYGLPDFVKIDVEGFEDRVLKTLQQPLPLVSFEFLPAYPEPALASISHLENLASYSYYFSAQEQYKHSNWRDASSILAFINSYSGPSGNIYAKQYP